MIGLVASEWLRFRSRRLLKVLIVLSVAGIVVALAIAGVQSHPPDGSSLTWSLERALLPDVIRGLSLIAIVLGLVVGASAVGASWQAGTITTLLTWEPRRIRVAIVRAVVVAVGVFLVVAVLLAIFIALYWVVTGLRGRVDVPPGWAREVVGTLGRVSALSAAVSVIGGALAMIGRHTAAALGATFVYLALIENVLRGIRPSLGWFLLGDSIAVVVNGSGLTIGEGVLTIPRAAATVAAYTLVLLSLAVVWFRVRDVQ